MHYREVSPGDKFRNIVFSFWEFFVTGEFDAPLPHEIFPDGCVSIAYHRNERLKFSRFFVAGLHIESIKTQVLTGDVFWGMRISPAVCADIFRCHPLEIESGLAEGRFPHLTENLSNELNDCQSFSAAVRVFETRLEAEKFSLPKANLKIAEAVDLIEQNRILINPVNQFFAVFKTPQIFREMFNVKLCFE